MNRYFIANLEYSVTEARLAEFVEAHGIVAEKVEVITDRETGDSRGFGFVVTRDPRILKLTGRMLAGRKLIVKVAQVRPPRMAGSFAGSR